MGDSVEPGGEEEVDTHAPLLLKERSNRTRYGSDGDLQLSPSRASVSLINT